MEFNMKYRDPLGVELVVGRKVVYMKPNTIFMQVGTVRSVDERGFVTVTGLAGGTECLDHLQIYVVGLDKPQITGNL